MEQSSAATCGRRRGRRRGAIVGGIAEDNHKRFRTYVVEEGRPSYRYDRQVVVGAELPEAGVTYYDVPGIRPHSISLYGGERPHRARGSENPSHCSSY